MDERQQRQREIWRQSQTARRAKMKAAGKLLLRIWCSPEDTEAIHVKVREIRRAARLKQLIALSKKTSDDASFDGKQVSRFSLTEP